MIEIGSRSIRLSWKKAFDGNTPIHKYVIQYRPLGHGITDDWDPSKAHNVSFTPGLSSFEAATNPTQNGTCELINKWNYLDAVIKV